MAEEVDKQAIFNRIVKNIEALMQLSKGDEQKTNQKIANETDIRSDLGIDSIEIMDLLASIENEFRISIDLEKEAWRRKVGDIVDLVSDKLKECYGSEAGR